MYAGVLCRLDTHISFQTVAVSNERKPDTLMCSYKNTQNQYSNTRHRIVNKTNRRHL